MYPVIPNGEETVAHNTQGKEKISSQEIFNKIIQDFILALQLFQEKIMKKNIDEPIFETKAFKLTKQEENLTKRARELGRKKFLNRAFKYDDEAVFPIENYKDLY